MAQDEALFVLQIIVDTVILDRECVSVDATSLSWVRLAFQLLSFDVVVLDMEIPISMSEPGQEITCPIRRGKSCVFRMQADSLRDALTLKPLSIMILEPPTQATAHLTRLMAFTCVDMVPHDRCVSSKAMSEWVNIQCSWTLYNHVGAAVGIVQGGVVLSHLGTTLAPHLQNALGSVQLTDIGPTSVVGSPPSPPPQKERDCDLAVQCNIATSPVPTSKPKACKVEVAVQCTESPPSDQIASPKLPLPSVTTNPKIDGEDDSDAFLFEHPSPPPLVFQREPCQHCLLHS
ncbi:hypothetical protein AeMF1_013087 [Aphanomyces euteiches]|uniref:Uncharacterized protein n=1 Tax=Aphanomyces euteiches TaxID=100861 RepID=A0A6G0WCA1_9STRA|nr:hypothetical protein Ae201684_017263 [Aphanomyces euteiches]KAH9081172.1 hypothetical protein Ae201684P_012144 [Aphanomyces euteiches]KAH9112609.1 hypothetical protein AeMF1_013087 [Aphanomyces euteiches]KAH9144953.1 hypothetical protein AeRB84_011126 [Aphanomyces euteiches]KAH9186030.1 hypothetical protein AeNC1_011995 [Aphanomyces euteiches]